MQLTPLFELANAEIASDHAWSLMNQQERAAYVRANPISLYSELAERLPPKERLKRLKVELRQLKGQPGVSHRRAQLVYMINQVKQKLGGGALQGMNMRKEAKRKGALKKNAVEDYVNTVKTPSKKPAAKAPAKPAAKAPAPVKKSGVKPNAGKPVPEGKVTWPAPGDKSPEAEQRRAILNKKFAEKPVAKAPKKGSEADRQRLAAQRKAAAPALKKWHETPPPAKKPAKPSNKTIPSAESLRKHAKRKADARRADKLAAKNSPKAPREKKPDIHPSDVFKKTTSGPVSVKPNAKAPKKSPMTKEERNEGIQKAFKKAGKPGSLHEVLGIDPKGKIPIQLLRKLADSDHPLAGKARMVLKLHGEKTGKRLEHPADFETYVPHPKLSTEVAPGLPPAKPPVQRKDLRATKDRDLPQRVHKVGKRRVEAF